MANFLNQWLGLNREPNDLTFLQVSLRGIIVFIAGLIILRVGAKRFLARKTAFDFVMAVILASVLARAINGSAPFFATIGAALVLVLFHRIIAMLAFHSPRFGTLVKGTEDVLIENGKVMRKALRRHHLSDDDLLEDLRLESCASPAEVECARLERSGEVSVIPKG